jgi:hypothetical protein
MIFDSVRVHTYYDGSKIPEWNQFGKASAKLQMAWANQHNYRFNAHVGRQLPKLVHAWDKIPLLIESMKRGDAEWHMVLDADIFITNLDLSLNDLLADYDFRVVYTGTDWKYPINAGVLLAHQSSLALFQAILKLQGACPDGLYEQGVLQQFRAGCPEWHHNIQPVAHRIFNSYSANADQDWIGTWDRGDFLVHFAGWRLAEIMATHGGAFAGFESKTAWEFSLALSASLLGLRKKITASRE